MTTGHAADTGNWAANPASWAADPGSVTPPPTGGGTVLISEDPTPVPGFGGATSRYLEAVRLGYEMKVEVEVYRSGAKVDRAFPIIGGSVRGDEDNPIQQTCTIVFADPDHELVPVLKTDPLLPNGVEVVIKHGVVYPDGDEELIPVGRFRLTRAESTQGAVECSGYDMGYTLSTSLEQPLFLPLDTEVGEAIVRIVEAKNPALKVRAPDTNEVITPQVVDIGVSPLQRCRKLAFGAGYGVSFNGVGEMVVGVLQLDSQGVPSLRFVDGKDSTSFFWKPSRVVDLDRVPSVMVVDANHSSLTSPIRVVVEDTNPNSATYAQGPYGRVVEVARTDKVNTISQARVFGRTELSRRSWTETFTWECLPNAAIRSGLLVSLTSEQLLLDEEPARVSSYELPLVPGPMRISGRTKVIPDYSGLEAD